MKNTLQQNLYTSTYVWIGITVVLLMPLCNFFKMNLKSLEIKIVNVELSSTFKTNRSSLLGVIYLFCWTHQVFKSSGLLEAGLFVVQFNDLET